MIGGNTSFGSGGWDQTVWDGLIPVDMSGRGPARSEYYDGSFRVVIPPQAVDHPIWRIVDDPERNREVLARMPMFHGTNLIDRLKPAATALGLSDRRPARLGRRDRLLLPELRPRAEPSPWRPTRPSPGEPISRRAGARATTAISASSGGTSSAGSPRTATEPIAGCGSRPTRSSTGPGQEIQVTARAYDEKLAETDRYRVVARLRRPTESESQPFDADRDEPGSPARRPAYRGKLHDSAGERDPRKPGLDPSSSSCSTWRRSTASSVVAQSSIELQVIDDPAEFRDPRPEPVAAHRARPGHGRTRDPDARRSWRACSAATRTRPSRRSSPARRSGTPPCSGCSCWACSPAEWILRRLKGLA